MLTKRQSGILLHPTSLAGAEGSGTLGEEAFAFVDFLVSAGQSVWQILPLGPTGFGDCPYSSFSAFAGNPDLISLSGLVRLGDLKASDLPPQGPQGNRVDFEACRATRTPVLQKAAQHFLTAKTTNQRHQNFSDFCQQQASWLNDYAFYRAMRCAQRQRSWQEWPKSLRDRHESALHQGGTELAAEIALEKYLQFVFFEQWAALKSYANRKGVQIFGDLPIFVAYDSADVWANRDLFQLDIEGQPHLVAGVPPDYFSEDGQLWGNPLYDWDHMREDGYAWWKARLQWNLQLFDLVRIDHFRGFEACWAVPAQEKTAINGTWQTGPGADFFQRIKQALGDLALIAEDLGVITPAVRQLRDQFSLPGMKILQFAFDSGPKNPYLPHQYPRNAVVYTGTHDNTTSRAWWESLPAEGKQQVRDYLGTPCRDMPWPLIRCALASTARLAIFPVQDCLRLGSDARMNQPGTALGNWNWRLIQDQLDPAIALRLAHLCEQFDRCTMEKIK
ncbi:4-alpha-glucanotransferase [Geopsychrobacter electrodiphilus]|uniref:4-alpha-glucanotransferase n=1 Tax=Geopsychrobacter electrodiphilus TaxID=225196 RepID=UPI0003617ABC|nr:4-alpha-glucanotransferase [Geopsychrobacter electrodiphilus]